MTYNKINKGKYYDWLAFAFYVFRYQPQGQNISGQLKKVNIKIQSKSNVIYNCLFISFNFESLSSL